MSLYGMMRTGVSGMNGQANRLSTVSDNIANSSTAGYKRASTEFSSLVLPSSGGAYNSGGVETTVRNHISDEGSLRFTTSSTDLAVKGNGFFLVSNGSGTPFLTRAGSFVEDPNGFLYNTGGFYLMGYPITNGNVNPVVNGYQGLERISLAQNDLIAEPSREGIFTANLPAGASIVAAADRPPTNTTASAQFTAKSSVQTYDNLGNVVVLDVYFTKTADNNWEVAVYDKANAAASGGFPYTPPAPLTTENYAFDPVTGKLASADKSISVTVPNGQPLEIDFSNTKQLAGDYTPIAVKIDGNSPSPIEDVTIGADGVVVANYKNGTTRAIYRIALADVPSPDNLQVLNGNVFATSAESGDVQIGFPDSGSFGTLKSGALEESNADIAQELTDMIEAQRNYTANSKVFQTGADLMDVLVNLKR
ncbi:flagellar hook protein FlgE [Phyllobacterium sp. 21LDTY02-6]|jgi:flagellar hook protein FlgE|uniref:flagellar hook protein FlgE n=1 Tax=unclassified Phyllobacterium TaxID=2638441 RepID=UPI0020206335|nr:MULTISPECIES: flagellar hook protein FlgE [unclassified Phyllobacterium]MCO4315665.1 flagellar hook protein FlgE [Phyllobacterium sp. 21LDTY02-6]MCX8280923.1 flagellar hook protein FlgE [Phyllobacterium sp. 0TCS1.6C]MCX8295789.1 flagellar hook protein FlgE [Phyllobacterium sp. 0TCS1.6A]